MTVGRCRLCGEIVFEPLEIFWGECSPGNIGAACNGLSWRTNRAATALLPTAGWRKFRPKGTT